MSLITIACCVPELRTIEFCPFPIENVLGGTKSCPPYIVHSMGNRQNSLAHTSHLSTSYSTFWEKIRAIQHC